MPGQVDGVKKVMNAAYRILSIRSRSEEELRGKLKEKGFNDSLISEAINSLRKKGYINDADFALNFSQYLLRTRHYGLIRITEELWKRGIPAETVRDTISRLKGEIDEKEMVTIALEGRLRGSDYSQMDEKEKQRVISHLYRKGFPLSTIYEILKSRKWNVTEDDRE